jgi:hypothetical protein
MWINWWLTRMVFLPYDFSDEVLIVAIVEISCHKKATYTSRASLRCVSSYDPINCSKVKIQNIK